MVNDNEILNQFLLYPIKLGQRTVKVLFARW